MTISWLIFGMISSIVLGLASGWLTGFILSH